MKRKLDELVTSLPSPIPSPDINAPSPSPLDDIELPGEDNTTEYAYNPTSLNTTAQYAQYNTSNNTSTLDTSASSDFYTPTPTSTSNSQNDSSYQPEYTPTSFTGGFSSFIGSTSLPFDIQKSLFSSDQDNAAVVTSSETNTVDNYEGNKIEVIGSTNPPPGSTPTIVPPPSAPHSDMSTPAQTSLASILNMLKQPPPTTTPVVQYTPTQSIPTPGTQQYTPTPSIPTPGDQHYNPVQGIPTPTGQQYNPVQSIPTPGSQQYTPVQSIPPPSNQQYTPVQSIPTPGSQQYTPVQSIPTPGSQQYTPVQSIPTPVNTQYPPPTPQSPDPLPLPPPPLPPSMFDLDEEFKPPPWLLNTETANTGSDYHPAPTPQVYTSPPPLPTRAPAYTSPPPGNIPIPPPHPNGIHPLPAVVLNYRLQVQTMYYSKFYSCVIDL
ncbi:proline-rich protein 2-like [Diaphorina citri]|uniref:Proline-rich protein 2-like n=1 Tax=Diaphorina citri TaxID=121845 RepID=A0A3Q0IIF5_DIACI|nr:proline-rich protein 2-like [Diaphorina citri]XP_026675927.1 proline-rich protein 2-like [Diaphorina citri]